MGEQWEKNREKCQEKGKMSKKNAHWGTVTYEINPVSANG
jgi:hypothetical protein